MVEAEEAEEVLVGVQLPQLADQFEGDDLAVGKRRLGAAAAKGFEVQAFQLVVHEAKYLKQGVPRGHGGLSLASTG